ncbi:MAG: polysaccharide deacetylase family protein [Luteolibacter sp.]|uniref:polysaccharide deacetylase family protein n=1 Tax=Luteolibacter sp. TaxID=1962973 RepID=UPI00326424E4
MDNPLNALGYKLLSSSLQADSPEQEKFGTLTRRGFLLAAATLTSCAAAEPLKTKPPIAAGAAPVKTPSNTAYRTPSIQGPVPRNPDMSLSSDFSKGSGISFSRVMVSGNYIAMTFDDGPHPQNTPRLLDMLRARNIKATFYVIGQSVNLYPQIVRRTVAEGHEIGNHSNTHRLLSKLSDAEISADLRRCHDAIGSAAGIQPRTMRPPYGGLLQRQREMVHAEFGYPIILWSVDPFDWKRPGANVITSRILAGASAGGIVLSHDLHGQTVDAMPATLDGLLSRGFKFVTVSQLLAMKTEPAPAQAAVAPSNS